MPETSVSAGYAQAILDMAAARGADPAALAKRASLDTALLESRDKRVPFSVFKALMQAAKVMCAEPAFGLHFGAESDFAEISIVGLICHSAETMGAAFHQMNRYARLAIEVEGHGSGARFALERIGEDLWLVDQRRNPNDFLELTEATMARFICETARHFGSAPFARFVHFTHAEPGYRAEYDRILKAPVYFGCERNAICIHESWLSIRNNLENKYVFGIFCERADALMARLQATTTLAGRVENLLMPLLHTDQVGMDKIASKLGMSRISLYRKLKQEGTSFETVLDNLRHEMALQYLGGQKTSVHEVAYLVGFSDPAAFSRAFKRWTGSSPSASR